jgi:hypothetical protein
MLNISSHNYGKQLSLPLLGILHLGILKHNFHLHLLIYLIFTFFSFLGLEKSFNLVKGKEKIRGDNIYIKILKEEKFFYLVKDNEIRIKIKI